MSKTPDIRPIWDILDSLFFSLRRNKPIVNPILGSSLYNQPVHAENPSAIPELRILLTRDSGSPNWASS